MSDHRFRNPGIFQRLPFRDWIRREMPNGADGFVAEDLDLVVRHYGAGFELDSNGRFMLCEIKIDRGIFNKAQQKTFSLIHGLLREADPFCERYIGFFRIHTTVEWPDATHFTVNGNKLTPQQFKDFLLGAHRVESMFDDGKSRQPVMPSRN